MTEAVLFDWDGTLLDSREALLSAWHAASTETLLADQNRVILEVADAIDSAGTEFIRPACAVNDEGGA